jgi:hypothetical protein
MTTVWAYDGNRRWTPKPSAEDGLMIFGPLLVALGIVFGDDHVVGYSLIGGGVVLALTVAWYRRTR